MKNEYSRDDLLGYNDWGIENHYELIERNDTLPFEGCSETRVECPKCKGYCFLHISDDLVVCPECLGEGYVYAALDVIQEQSGEYNSVGGMNYPSKAVIHKKLFSNRVAAEQSAICGVIIHCFVADVVHPDGTMLSNQILLAWEFDDGALLFGAYEDLVLDEIPF